jgi:hypothetical protein
VAGGSKFQTTSLEAARAVQTALTSGSTTSIVEAGLQTTDGPASLGGLTAWLRDAAGGLLGLLALPIRLVELLARALMTAGSGLIAPLSLLLAYTAFAIKDRGLLASRRLIKTSV